jgi:signal transduction histidine kinase
MTQPAAGRVRNWSLRKRVARGSIAALALLSAMFALDVIALLEFKSKGDDIINRWQPAYTTSQDLLSDLVNQETGLRGFTLGKNESFLAPYHQYELQQSRQQRDLRRLISNRSDLVADLEAFSTTAQQWHTNIAQPYIARVRRGDPTVATAPASDAAKAAFDKIRTASARLTADLRAVRDRAIQARISAVRLVWIAVGASVALILVAGYGLWRGLQKAVLEPIENLATQTRHVAGGAIEERIVSAGPPEIAGLGEDVNRMRARIANELSRVELARMRLVHRSEELSRSNADLEQFAYVASHDLSEPLRKVANFCQLLERQYSDQLDDKAKQYIAFAVDGAKRMQALINDLLSFSRVGRTTAGFEPVDTGQVMTRALATLEDRIVSSGADIVRGPLPVLDGDATLLVALFQNLVGNSLKYRDTERLLRVDVTATRQGSDWLFTIADNGIGIERQYAERIFTIFQRLHLRDKYGGTGIGLALCRKIVEFHKGTIWLGESTGPGATFHFTIPEHGSPEEAADPDEY